MRTIFEKLKPAQHEVQKTAHDQDLIEVPKRSLLDREAEHTVATQGMSRSRKFGQPDKWKLCSPAA
jgi:hypothetical protein